MLTRASPPFLQRSPFGGQQHITLDRTQDRREAAVRFQPLKVFDAVATSQVQEDQRQHHLDVEPALGAGHMHVLSDRRAKANGLDQIEIQRQARQ